MKFGVQKFLNPVDSSDNGYIKFSLRPAERGRMGHSVKWRMADCSEYIELDFSGWAQYQKNPPKNTVRESLAILRSRRRKLKVFITAVNAMADKVFQAMDEDEETFKEYLKNAKN